MFSQYVLQPTFTEEHVATLNHSSKLSIALDGTKYLPGLVLIPLFFHSPIPPFPGIVGLNNIKANDYMNVILHTLAHVSPLRDYLLRPSNYCHIKRPPGDQKFMLGEPPSCPLCQPSSEPPVRRLGELFRKLWNPRNFKSHVSPHEMLQAVSVLSKKRFKITEQGGWSHTLH